MPALSRATVWPGSLLGTAEFSTVVESSSPWSWTARCGGTRAATALTPRRRWPGRPCEWYLAEGATHSGFDLFYLVQNPNAVDADARGALPAAGAAAGAHQDLHGGANSRFNIWVNLEGAELASTDVSAV